jgi:hypothetical protein
MVFEKGVPDLHPNIADVCKPCGAKFSIQLPLKLVVTIFIPPRLTLKSSTFCPQSALKFYLRTSLTTAIMSLYAVTDWFCNPDVMCLP